MDAVDSDVDFISLLFLFFKCVIWFVWCFVGAGFKKKWLLMKKKLLASQPS